MASRIEDETAGLYEQWRSPLLRYLLAFRMGVPDAEEIVQEVFLRLFRHLHQDKSRENLQGWLFKVAHNLALKNRILAQRHLAVEPDPQLDAGPGPEEQYAGRQRQELLLSVMRALPEQDQWVLALRAEGLRYREIAEVIGISLGAVANSLAKSFARLNRAECWSTHVAQ